MKQLDLVGFSQQTITDYGPVTVASTTTNGDSAGSISTNNEAGPRRWPVTIRWASGSQVGCIHGQFTRLASGEIEATYSSAAELRICLRLLCLSFGKDLDKILLAHKKKG